MKFFKCITHLLVIIGALNMGLIGFFQYDLLSDLLGGTSAGLTRTIFGIIGLAGLWSLFCLFKCCGKGGSCGCGPNCNCSNCRNNRQQ